MLDRKSRITEMVGCLMAIGCVLLGVFIFFQLVDRISYSSVVLCRNNTDLAIVKLGEHRYYNLRIPNERPYCLTVSEATALGFGIREDDHIISYLVSDVMGDEISHIEFVPID